MPPIKHLILDKDSDLIAVRDGAGALDSKYRERKSSRSFFGGLVPVYCETDTTSEKFEDALKVLTSRMGKGKLFQDVRSAVGQLQEMYGKGGTGYIAVGGSPKLVKWLLKKRGFAVVTVNVSGVGATGARTEEFTEYLRRKIAKLGSPDRYVLMDFADTGVSLIKLKQDVLELVGGKSVSAVAVGTSHEFHATKNQTNKMQIDKILTGIPDLTKALTEQTIKLYVLGRNKEKNPYATWSFAQGDKLAGAPEAGSGIKASTLSEHYQSQKASIPRLMELDLIEINIESLIEDDTSDSGSDTGSGSCSDFTYEYCAGSDSDF